MFKLKYNALSLVQIAFGFLNSILLLKVFGVSTQTDAYFIGDIIMGGSFMVQVMAIEQFMYFYNDLKARDRAGAHGLYAYALFLTLAIGACALVLLNVLSGPVIALFAYKLDPLRLETLKRLFPVFSLLAVFYPLHTLNVRLLNGEARFAYPYALGIIPSLFTAGAMLYVYFTGGSDILWVLAASVCGMAAAALLGLAAVRACGVPLRLSFSHHLGREFVRNSFKVKFGHNINNVLAPLITNNILSSLTPGAVSYFGYAWKIVTVTGNLATGPSAKMFASAVSAAWPLGDTGRIKALGLEFLRLIIPLFTVSVLAAYAVLPHALKAVSSAGLEPNDISAIGAMFLALSAWYLVGLIESSYMQVCIASRRSRIFAINNSVFVALYFGAAFSARERFGIYAIPLGLIVAQLVSLALYRRSAAAALSARAVAPGKAPLGGSLWNAE